MMYINFFIETNAYENYEETQNKNDKLIISFHPLK